MTHSSADTLHADESMDELAAGKSLRINVMRDIKSAQKLLRTTSTRKYKGGHTDQLLPPSGPESCGRPSRSMGVGGSFRHTKQQQQQYQSEWLAENTPDYNNRSKPAFAPYNPSDMGDMNPRSGPLRNSFTFVESEEAFSGIF